jgi:phosphate transport system substrate-binding protein
MKRLSILATIIICLSVFFSYACTNTKIPVTKIQKSLVKDFVIAGSGSNLPITRKLIEAFSQKNNIVIELPNSIGSGGAIKATKENAIKLGLISRSLKDSEKIDGLNQMPYARIGIILGTNLDVQENNLTYDDLVQIFLGKKNKWQNGKMIVVIAREEGDSSNNKLANEIPGFKKALLDSQINRRWQVTYTDAESAQSIVSTSSAIGFTDTGALSSLKLKIKPMQINGIAPTTKNIKNGTYKLYKDLYFIYKEPLDKQTQSFLDFVYSPQGKAIIEKNGGIPLRGK